MVGGSFENVSVRDRVYENEFVSVAVTNSVPLCVTVKVVVCVCSSVRVCDLVNDSESLIDICCDRLTESDSDGVHDVDIVTVSVSERSLESVTVGSLVSVRLKESEAVKECVMLDDTDKDAEGDRDGDKDTDKLTEIESDVDTLRVGVIGCVSELERAAVVERVTEGLGDAVSEVVMLTVGLTETLAEIETVNEEESVSECDRLPVMVHDVESEGVSLAVSSLVGETDGSRVELGEEVCESVKELVRDRDFVALDSSVAVLDTDSLWVNDTDTDSDLLVV